MRAFAVSSESVGGAIPHSIDRQAVVSRIHWRRLRFALLRTAWLFRAGSRIRLAIAGAEMDHSAQAPHGRPPVLTVHRGAAHASAIELPWRTPLA